MGIPATDKLTEYRRRYQFWTERALEQFSFSNNLLLTISIAMIGYFYKEGRGEFRNLTICWPGSGIFDLDATLFSLGTIFTGLSVLFGFIVFFARLCDFKLTRHITLIRKRIYILHVKVFPNKVPKERKLARSFFDLIRLFYSYEKFIISPSDCYSFDNKLKDKFLRLREITNGLSRLSWVAFNFQSILLFFGMSFYILLMVR